MIDFIDIELEKIINDDCFDLVGDNILDTIINTYQNRYVFEDLFNPRSTDDKINDFYRLFSYWNPDFHTPYLIEKYNSLFFKLRRLILKKANIEDTPRPIFVINDVPDIQNIIFNELKDAQHSIFVAVAWFTNKVLYDILLEKANSGVEVQIVVIDDDINNGALDFEQLYQAGIKVWYVDEAVTMHNKFCIVDYRMVISGSYNWTNKASSNHENIMIVKNHRKSVDDYIAEFNRIVENYYGTPEAALEKVILRLKAIRSLILLEDGEDLKRQRDRLRTLSVFIEPGLINKIDEALQLCYSGDYKNGLIQFDIVHDDIINRESDNDYYYEFIYSNNAYGLYNKNTGMITPFIYDRYYCTLHLSLIIVVINDKYGVLDLDGNHIIPVEYDKVYYINKNLFLAEKDDTWYCFNEVGKEVISDKYDIRERFSIHGSEHLNEYSIVYKNGKCGLIHISGCEIFETNNDSVEKYDKILIFRNTSYVQIFPEHIQEAARKALETEEVNLRVIETSLANHSLFLFCGNSKFQLQSIQSSNNELILLCVDDVVIDCSDFINITYSKDGKKGFVQFSKCGTEYKLIKPSYDTIEAFSDCLVVSKEGKYSCIDFNGNIILEFNNDSFFKIEDKFIVVENNNKVDIFNKKGKCISKQIYDNFITSLNKFAKVELNGKYGCIIDDGSVLAPPIYDDINPVVNKGIIDFFDDLNNIWEGVVLYPKSFSTSHFITQIKNRISIIGYMRSNRVIRRIKEDGHMLSFVSGYRHPDNQEDNNIISQFAIKDNVRIDFDFVKKSDREFPLPYVRRDKGKNILLINNETNELIISFKLETPIYYIKEALIFKKANKFYFLNTSNCLLNETIFEDIDLRSLGGFSCYEYVNLKPFSFLPFVLVKIKGFWGILDSNFNWIVNPEYKKITYIKSVWLLGESRSEEHKALSDYGWRWGDGIIITSDYKSYPDIRPINLEKGFIAVNQNDKIVFTTISGSVTIELTEKELEEILNIHLLDFTRPFSRVPNSLLIPVSVYNNKFKKYDSMLD